MQRSALRLRLRGFKILTKNVLKSNIQLGTLKVWLSNLLFSLWRLHFCKTKLLPQFPPKAVVQQKAQWNKRQFLNERFYRQRRLLPKVKSFFKLSSTVCNSNLTAKLLKALSKQFLKNNLWRKYYIVNKGFIG
mgnify:CR=1 FL=1